MALTIEEFWQKHLEKHPDWADEDKKIQLSVGTLRGLLEDGYRKGYAKRNEELAHIKRLLDSARLGGGGGGDQTDYAEMFKDLFRPK